ncbi:MAG: hypothetical protein N3D74_02645 [Caldisericia bacterium]|nr:hypothetical protein [Caldisericia bacterium]
MKKFILVIIILIMSTSISCYRRENNIKIIVLDELGNKISQAKILINNIEFLTDNNGELIVKNEGENFKIFVYKENYLPYDEFINYKENSNVEIKLISLNSKKEEIIKKIIEKVSTSKSFYVNFIGNLNGDKENFNLYCNLEKFYFKITSPLLNKEVEIKKEDDKYYYNQKELPEETLDYFPLVLDLVSNSIEFIKNLPQLTKNLSISSNYNYIKFSFNIEKNNLKITGYILSNYPNYNIINEQINILAIDEMGRTNDFILNFYNFE